MQLLLTYPFSDGTIGAMKGDYTNMTADLQLDLTDPKAFVGSLGPAHPAPGWPAHRRACPACPSACRPRCHAAAEAVLPGGPLPGESSTSPSSSSTAAA